jgi:hypothetical protein
LTPPPYDDDGDPASAPVEATPFCAGDGLVYPSIIGFALAPRTGRETPQPITVVQRDGRWFVSPVATVLRLLDGSIGGFDRGDLYDLLNLSWKLEPEATLTLGTPIAIDTAASRTHVYALHGTAGQRIVGAFTSGAGTHPDTFGGSAAVYDEHGNQATDGVLLDGYPVTLDHDGTYKIVVHAFGVRNGTMTIWDAQNAPVAALQHEGDGESCTYTELPGGSSETSCSGSASSGFGSSGTLGPDPGDATATTVASPHTSTP